MRAITKVPLALLLATTMFGVAHGQQGRTVTVEEVIERITKSETAVLTRMKAFHPLVEVYIQNLAPDDQLGTIPTQDEYFLGQFDFKDGPKLKPLSALKRGDKAATKGLGIQ